LNLAYLKQGLIRAIESLPGYRQIERRLFFRHVKRLRIEAGLRLAFATNHTVVRGIFAGMKLHSKSSWGADQFTVLSGQYESELYNIIQRAAVRPYDAFLDIGCANGFYAVGFAMISKDCDVIAYDVDERARHITSLNAGINGVSDRVFVKNKADASELGETISRYRSIFVLVDIEGNELDLINPSECPDLVKCDLLIEVHGQTDEVAKVLMNRFSTSHRPTIISRQARNPFQYEKLSCTFEDEAWVLVSEGRGVAKNNWLFLERT
jgi:ribosomal protein L11 methylase PrmA